MLELLTAAVLITCAIVLWRLLPHALAHSSPTQLREANRLLEIEIGERKRIEAELLRGRDDLENRVQERTAELARTNEELRQAVQENSRLAIAMQNSPAGIVMTDPNLPDNPLIFVNPAFTRITGYTAAEALGRNGSYLHGPETSPELLQQLREHMAARTSFSGVLLSYRKDGLPFWNDLTVSPVLAEDGTLLNFVALLMDVTDRENVREALRISEQRLRALVKSLDELVFEFDPEGHYVNVWTDDESLLVRPRSEMLGRSLQEVLGEEAARPFLEAFRRVVETRKPESIVYDLAEIGGRSFMARISPVLAADGSCRNVCMLSRDITARREMEEALRVAKEEAERVNRAKSEFLSRMSHELRTPLNAILGFGQLLQMEDLNEIEADNVEQILKAGRHLLGLINEVLQISGIEAGRLNLSIEPVEIGDALKDACALVRPLSQARGIALELPAKRNLGHLLADRQRLLQVLLNFLSNAVKYNRDAGKVTLTSGPGAEGFWRISVIDNGPGIPPEKMGALFSPFERLGADRTGIEGTGLGLALSKKLIEVMGGRVGVESTPGLGSTFWLELPETQGLAFPESLPALAPVAESTPRLRILYIEDNLANRKLVEHILADRADVELLSASQGSLGLELAREHLPDLILLDLHLPDMNGDAVLRHLLAEPVTREIPVVMVSADATPRQAERLLALGAREYLTKPLDVRRFLQVFNEVLEGSAGSVVA